MQYALLYYGSEDLLAELSWKEKWPSALGEDGSDMFAGAARLEVQLLPTTTAVTVRWGTRSPVLDGPRAFTKHELLNLKVIDVPNLDKALALVETSLRDATGLVACEIRPLVSLDMPYEPAVLEVSSP
jgi:hypothetical protein